MSSIDAIFAWLCGLHPGHVWMPGGDWLPVCQRCVGLYAGILLGSAWHFFVRPRSTPGWLWAHGFLMAITAFFGLHLFPETGAVRTATGFAFGLGAVAFLWTGIAGKGDVRMERATSRDYAAAVLVSLAVLLWACQAGGRGSWIVLNVLCALGLVCAAVLAAAVAGQGILRALSVFRGTARLIPSA